MTNQYRPDEAGTTAGGSGMHYDHMQGQFSDICRYWDLPWRCPVVSCSENCDYTLPQLFDHIETCEKLGSRDCPEYWCECGMAHRLRGMGCRLDIKHFGKNLKKYIVGAFDFPNPDVSGTETRRSSQVYDSNAFDIENLNISDVPSGNAMPGVSEFQIQPSAGLSSSQGYSFPADFHGQGDSSPLSTVPYSQGLSLSIPDQNCFDQYAQNTSAGSPKTSAPSIYSPQSARSRRTVSSTLTGSTVCEEDTSPSTDPSWYYNSPMCETPNTPFPLKEDVISSNCAEFPPDQAAVHVDEQHGYNMSGMHGDPGPLNPSFDATTNLHGPFEGQPLVYSTDLRDSVVHCPTNLGDVGNHKAAGNRVSSRRVSFKTDSSPPHNAHQHHICPRCNWTPDGRSTRTAQKMKQAVQKHIKRKHESPDYQCSVCGITIRKRPDNLKDHVRKKHPDHFNGLYPDSGVKAKTGRGAIV